MLNVYKRDYSVWKEMTTLKESWGKSNSSGKRGKGAASWMLLKAIFLR
jgi:hypothetical protein